MLTAFKANWCDECEAGSVGIMHMDGNKEFESSKELLPFKP